MKRYSHRTRMRHSKTYDYILPCQITTSLQPSRLEIHNDSALHAHHAPMAGSTSTETHFRLVVASEQFRAKPQPARHRMLYALLGDEMARDGGIHALQLRTLTPEEDEREKERERRKVQEEERAVHS